VGRRKRKEEKAHIKSTDSHNALNCCGVHDLVRKIMWKSVGARKIIINPDHVLQCNIWIFHSTWATTLRMIPVVARPGYVSRSSVVATMCSFRNHERKSSKTKLQTVFTMSFWCVQSSKDQFAANQMLYLAVLDECGRRNRALIASLRSYTIQGVHEQLVATAGHATGKAQQSSLTTCNWISAIVCSIKAYALWDFNTRTIEQIFGNMH
jgi:hypothetical protein